MPQYTEKEVIRIIMEAAETKEVFEFYLPILIEIEGDVPGRLEAIKFDLTSGYYYAAEILDILHLAAKKGNSGMVLFALKTLNIKVGIQNSNWETPLMITAREGHTKVAKLLLDNKAEADTIDLSGETPLTRAFQRWFCGVDYSYGEHRNAAQEITKLLFDRGANVNHRGEDQKNALYHVYTSGYNEDFIMEGVKLLMSSPINLEIIDNTEVRWIVQTLKQYPYFVPAKPPLCGEGINESYSQAISDAIKQNKQNQLFPIDQFSLELSGLFDELKLVENPLSLLFDLPYSLSDMTVRDIAYTIALTTDTDDEYAPTLGAFYF